MINRLIFVSEEVSDINENTLGMNEKVKFRIHHLR